MRSYDAFSGDYLCSWCDEPATDAAVYAGLRHPACARHAAEYTETCGDCRPPVEADGLYAGLCDTCDGPSASHLRAERRGGAR